MNTIDRFELEQQILDCWRILDDLKYVINSDSDKDELLNAICSLYEKRFHSLLESFHDWTGEYHEKSF